MAIMTIQFESRGHLRRAERGGEECLPQGRQRKMKGAPRFSSRRATEEGRQTTPRVYAALTSRNTNLGARDFSPLCVLCRGAAHLRGQESAPLNRPVRCLERVCYILHYVFPSTDLETAHLAQRLVLVGEGTGTGRERAAGWQGREQEDAWGPLDPYGMV